MKAIYSSLILISAFVASSLQAAVDFNVVTSITQNYQETSSEFNVTLHDEPVLVNLENDNKILVKLLHESDTTATVEFSIFVNENMISQPCLIVEYGKEASIVMGTKDATGSFSESLKLICLAHHILTN